MINELLASKAIWFMIGFMSGYVFIYELFYLPLWKKHYGKSKDKK